jgi:predicted transposase/invertase (TIGR01784 family)
MSRDEQKVYYEYRNKTLKERDYIVSAEEKGLAEGIEKGIEKVAKNMLAEGDSIEKIMRLTGLTREQIEKLK